LFKYLTKYMAWDDIDEIYMYNHAVPGIPLKYNGPVATFRRPNLKVEDVTSLQQKIASTDWPVDIYLVKTGHLRTATRPKGAIPNVASLPASPAPAPKAYYPPEDELRDLLQELRQVINKHDKKHGRYAY